MPMIRECVVTTADAQGQRAYRAASASSPTGRNSVIAPFRPSTSLDNLQAVPFAVANYIDDVRIFAGCLTGPARLAAGCDGRFSCAAPSRGAGACRTFGRVCREHEQRPRFHAKSRTVQHAPFEGMNRAKAAVLELAVLSAASIFCRAKKSNHEMAYLEIAIDKTAGPDEAEAWSWLVEKVQRHYMAE